MIYYGQAQMQMKYKKWKQSRAHFIIANQFDVFRILLFEYHKKRLFSSSTLPLPFTIILIINDCRGIRYRTIF